MEKIGQNFHISFRSGPRWLVPPDPDREIYKINIDFFTLSLCVFANVQSAFLKEAKQTVLGTKIFARYEVMFLASRLLYFQSDHCPSGSFRLASHPSCANCGQSRRGRTAGNAKTGIINIILIIVREPFIYVLAEFVR